MNNLPDETQIIHAPVIPAWGASIIYSVTLMNGYVVTSPAGFGERPSEPPPPPRPLPAQR